MPTDGRQLELMLNSLRDQEEAMTAAFTGSSYTETLSRTYTYVPEEDGSEILFRFSDFKKMLPKDAVRYCIPGEAIVSISFEGETLYNRELEFAQFGVVFGLSPALFTDRKDPSYAIFNPVTGGLQEIGSMVQ